MLSSPAPKPATLTETQEVARNTGSLVSRKIWLPKFFYDALPYFYLTAGFAAFFYLVFSAACLHLGELVLRRRKRPQQADTRFDD